MLRAPGHCSRLFSVRWYLSLMRPAPPPAPAWGPALPGPCPLTGAPPLPRAPPQTPPPCCFSGLRVTWQHRSRSALTWGLCEPAVDSVVCPPSLVPVWPLVWVLSPALSAAPAPGLASGFSGGGRLESLTWEGPRAPGTRPPCEEQGASTCPARPRVGGLLRVLRLGEGREGLAG